MGRWLLLFVFLLIGTTVFAQQQDTLAYIGEVAPTKDKNYHFTLKEIFRSGDQYDLLFTKTKNSKPSWYGKQPFNAKNFQELIKVSVNASNYSLISISRPDYKKVIKENSIIGSHLIGLEKSSDGFIARYHGVKKGSVGIFQIFYDANFNMASAVFEEISGMNGNPVYLSAQNEQVTILSTGKTIENEVGVFHFATLDQTGKLVGEFQITFNKYTIGVAEEPFTLSLVGDQVVLKSNSCFAMYDLSEHQQIVQLNKRDYLKSLMKEREGCRIDCIREGVITTTFLYGGKDTYGKDQLMVLHDPVTTTQATGSLGKMVYEFDEKICSQYYSKTESENYFKSLKPRRGLPQAYFDTLIVQKDGSSLLIIGNRVEVLYIYGNHYYGANSSFQFYPTQSRHTEEFASGWVFHFDNNGELKRSVPMEIFDGRAYEQNELSSTRGNWVLSGDQLYGTYGLFKMKNNKGGYPIGGEFISWTASYNTHTSETNGIAYFMRNNLLCSSSGFNFLLFECGQEVILTNKLEYYAYSNGKFGFTKFNMLKLMK
jgi:hypothetical protein